MSDEPLLSAPEALARLDRALAQYQTVSGKTSAAIVAQKGAHLVMGNSDPRFGDTYPGLHQLFSEQQPAQGSIYLNAKARGFRVGRRVFGGDLSPQAKRRASDMMQGLPSVLASPSEDGERFSFVRRGVRLTKSGRPRRVHFRFGRISYAVGANNVLRRSTDRVLNFRAVATFFELQIRAQGRRFLAAGFLFRRWRRLAQSDPRRGGGEFRVLVNQNPRSSVSPLGEAELRTTAAGDATLRITTRVPGVETIGRSRGLFARAMSAVARDIDLYLARKQQESLVATVRESLATP